jgi:hypothetical protein
MPPLHDLELYLQLVRVALEGLKLLVDLIQALWAGFRKIQRWILSLRRPGNLLGQLRGQVRSVFSRSVRSGGGSLGS